MAIKSDDIIYNLSTIECFFGMYHNYTQTVFMVKNQKITDIMFAYFIPDTLLDSYCNVDFTQSNIFNIHLYDQVYDMSILDDDYEEKKKDTVDGRWVLFYSWECYFYS